MFSVTRFLAAAAAIVMTLIASSSAPAQETQPAGAKRLYPVVRDGKRGYIDRVGKVIVQPQFDRAYAFSDGMGRVESAGKIGYVNAAGAVEIAPQFQAGRDFSQGLAAAKINGKWGYIDHSGKFVIPPQYDGALDFSEGLAAVGHNNKYGWLEKWGYVNTSGKMVIEPAFSGAYPFSEGVAHVVRGMNAQEFIDKTGKVVLHRPEFWTYSFSEGLSVIMHDGEMCGYMDTTGKPLTKLDYSLAEKFSEGLAAVKVGDKWGYIDKSFNKVVKPQYNWAGEFSEGLAAVGINGKAGFIDKQGKVVIEPRFDWAFGFQGGLARVRVADRYGYIDRSGKYVWEPGASAPAAPAAAKAAEGELVTSPRTLGEEYPQGPKITLKGADFTVEHDGKRTHFVRPMVVPVKVAPADGGRKIFVAPGGTGDGSENAPMGNITDAIAKAKAGDAVIIGQGEYAERVVARASGSPDKPILITAAEGALPRIVLPYGEPRKDQHVSPMTLSGKYLHVNGLVLEGYMGRSDGVEDEMYAANGIDWGRGTDKGSIHLTNCITYWDLHCAYKGGGVGPTVEGCVGFWIGSLGGDHGIYAPVDYCTIRGCLFFEVCGAGIHAYSTPKNLVIENNLCVNNRMWGIIVGGSQCVVANNTCVGNGMGIMPFREGCMNNKFVGNICAFNLTNASVDGKPSGNEWDYNLLFPGAGSKDPQFNGKHDIHADPQFMDGENGDFRLKPSSPARNAMPTADGKKANIGAL